MSLVDCNINSKVEDLDGDLETDGPTVTCSRNGDLLLAMRHFVSGRFDYNRSAQSAGSQF